MFIDKIPSQLCRMQGLQIMDFGNNHLTGPIPRCFGNLSGMILDEDGIMSSLEWFDFDTSMTQVFKGRELEFTKTLAFLANMNLSRNNLVGSIPKEITNLSGIIPQSISELNSLSHLNLSYNNLSGRIPTGNQLRTLDDPSSSYLGNSELCGVPLSRNCPSDEKSQPPTTTGHRDEHKGDDAEIFWFYMAIMCGYATGLWGFIGVLLLKKAWRYAYFQRGDGQ
ncbi:hypothetical protein Vadar_006007 [Vaccinium darrowii]|uniref:Uncharacterized protein n=1 Tax=Vaccinium darrowii TaxID=229202 RepID=A0ACB7YK24_9ERIC|nr:hypothetical protein Vadar_006007 [Vaccinium darrowii]